MNLANETSKNFMEMYSIFAEYSIKNNIPRKTYIPTSGAVNKIPCILFKERIELNKESFFVFNRKYLKEFYKLGKPLNMVYIDGYVIFKVKDEYIKIREEQ